jgi:hypothetical protein
LVWQTEHNRQIHRVNHDSEHGKPAKVEGPCVHGQESQREVGLKVYTFLSIYGHDDALGGDHHQLLEPGNAPDLVATVRLLVDDVDEERVLLELDLVAFGAGDL